MLIVQFLHLSPHQMYIHQKISILPATILRPLNAPYPFHKLSAQIYLNIRLFFYLR